MASNSERNPAAEAWGLMAELVFSARPRIFQLAQEFDLAPMQLRALKELEPDREVPMSALAGTLFCDASNVTGIVDRLEARGLIERRPAHDRRVKMLAVTPEGARVRKRLVERMSQPPPAIAALSREDARVLRDVLRAAVDGAKAADDGSKGRAPAGSR